MSRRFLALTGLLSAATFGGVWVSLDAMEAPATSAIPAASLMPAATEATAPGPTPASPAASVYYSGCREVRAAGAAPLHRSDPGYREGMDGDGDGIACEPPPLGADDSQENGAFNRRHRRR